MHTSHHTIPVQTQGSTPLSVFCPLIFGSHDGVEGLSTTQETNKKMKTLQTLNGIIAIFTFFVA